MNTVPKSMLATKLPFFNVMRTMAGSEVLRAAFCWESAMVRLCDDIWDVTAPVNMDLRDSRQCCRGRFSRNQTNFHRGRAHLPRRFGAQTRPWRRPCHLQTKNKAQAQPRRKKTNVSNCTPWLHQTVFATSPQTRLRLRRRRGEAAGAGPFPRAFLQTGQG